MPKRLEKELRARIRRLHPKWSQERKDAYIYGTLRKTGWVPRHQRRTRAQPRHNSRTRVQQRGYKKCVINVLSRIKFATPTAARVAMRRAVKKCSGKRR
jgi:hypothetical protein